MAHAGWPCAATDEFSDVKVLHLNTVDYVTTQPVWASENIFNAVFNEQQAALHEQYKSFLVATDTAETARTETARSGGAALSKKPARASRASPGQKKN